MKSYTCSGLRLQGDKLSINIGGILYLYHADFGNITDHLYKLLEQPQLQNLKYIFIMGGFAKYTLSCNASAGLFSSYLILISKYIYTVVMQRPTIFGHNSSMITSRRVRKSYWYKVLFVEGWHDQSRKTFNEVYYDNVFNAVVHAGEEI